MRAFFATTKKIGLQKALIRFLLDAAGEQGTQEGMSGDQVFQRQKNTDSLSHPPLAHKQQAGAGSGVSEFMEW